MERDTPITNEDKAVERGTSTTFNNRLESHKENPIDEVIEKIKKELSDDAQNNIL